MYTEDAISKTTIIVIAVSVVLIVAAAGVVLFTTSTPATVPHMNATVEAAGNIVYLYHDGGDPFPKDNLLVRINGEDIPTDSYSLLHSQEWPWTAGKTVKVPYNGAGNPETVQVIYKNGNKQTIVFSQQLQTPAVIPISTVVSIPPTTVPVPTESTSGITTSPAAGSTQTIPVIPVKTPPPAVTPAPPRADFVVKPLSGPNPLTDHFTDQSSGIPVSWNWDFGDGSTSTEQNPVHTYSIPGTYTVSLSVSNNFGSDKKTKTGLITTGIAPVAGFSGSPRSGDAPLEVHFTDVSSGQPVAWSWDFGDGGTSTLENPTHVYSDGGIFPVSLTVANLFGADSRIQSGYITAGTPPNHDIYLVGSAYGYLQPDGFIAFQVTTSDSWIKIGGRIYNFRPGDMVQLIIGDPQSGFIDAAGNSITAFNFNQVRMYINNTPATGGIVTDIDVTGYRDYRSSTTLIIPAGGSGTTFIADAGKAIAAPGQQIIVKNFKPDSNGKMAFTKKLFDVSYVGGAESYQLG